VLGPFDPLRRHNTDAVDNRVLTPKPQVGPPTPGLLESGPVFAPQGQTTAGTPAAGGMSGGGGSGGVGVMMLRGSPGSNMTAPSAGGGVR
jgi:hypothetical protein